MITLIKTFTSLELLRKNLSYNSSLYKCWKLAKREESAPPLCFDDKSVQLIFPSMGNLEQLYVWKAVSNTWRKDITFMHFETVTQIFNTNYMYNYVSENIIKMIRIINIFWNKHRKIHKPTRFNVKCCVRTLQDWRSLLALTFIIQHIIWNSDHFLFWGMDKRSLRQEGHHPLLCFAVNCGCGDTITAKPTTLIQVKTIRHVKCFWCVPLASVPSTQKSLTTLYPYHEGTTYQMLSTKQCNQMQNILTIILRAHRSGWFIVVQGIHFQDKWVNYCKS